MNSWHMQMKELVDQAWEKHTHDHFRAPTAHDMKILIKTCLMALALKTQNDNFKFVHELKQEMHVDLKYVEFLEKEIDELESDKAEFSNMYDILLYGMIVYDLFDDEVELLGAQCLIEDEDFVKRLRSTYTLCVQYEFGVTWIVQDIIHKFGLFYFSIKFVILIVKIQVAYLHKTPIGLLQKGEEEYRDMICNLKNMVAWRFQFEGKIVSFMEDQDVGFADHQIG
ncbi:hypothetical protein Tco_1036853 [Tanacetum coccineum]